MSTDALTLINDQRKAQLEESPFSEVGTLDGSIQVKGIFDDSYNAGEEGLGNLARQKQIKRFLVAELPTFVPRTSTIVIDSISYIVTKGDYDKFGIPVLWLQQS